MKHLEPDYEVDKAPSGFIAHFWDTIESIGGVNGIIILFVLIIVFYFVVEYTVQTGRANREAKKKR